MKRKIIAAAFFMMVFFSALIAWIGWHLGYFTAFGIRAERGLLDALEIAELPPGAVLRNHRIISWVDYFLEAELAVSPATYRRLLTGRDFSGGEWEDGGLQVSAFCLPDYEPFLSAESWHWSRAAPYPGPGRTGASCAVFFDSTRTGRLCVTRAIDRAGGIRFPARGFA